MSSTLTRRSQAVAAAASCLLVLFGAGSTFAQVPAGPAVDAYRTEFSIAVWAPPPTITTAGEHGGVRGTPIDVNRDFGLSTNPIPVLEGAFQIARRHRVRATFAPMRYVTTAALSHDITFAGVVYPANEMTTATISWKAFQGSYEYAIVMTPRLRVGIVGEIDRTNVQVRMQNAVSNELTSASTPTIPTAGASAAYVFSPRVSVDGEVAELYVPDRPGQNYGGHYTRVASRVTVSAAAHVGGFVGFRLIDIRHQGLADSGTLRLPGVMVGVVIHR